VEKGRATRKLAAILAADVVGYSRLVRDDEEGTIERLRAIREELVDPSVARGQGRVVKTMGDGLLIEFPSVVDAVRTAVDLQRVIALRNVDVPAERRIEFRIGINLGDIVIDGDDILGDGVNIAARLEALADPGGICISGAAHDQVEGKLDIEVDDLGRQTVKNIQKPVQVFRVRIDEEAAPAYRPGAEQAPVAASRERPSIAVLPLDNMSGDPDQEYFSDGISEDLITALSRIHWFFVCARNSSFSYKGTSKDIRQIANELGVRYVVEGSVRKAGKNVRITAQLIDGSTGNHVWAERYDQELENVFDVQDKIVEMIVGALEPAMSKSEIQRSRKKRPDNLDAWDICQRGWWHRNRNTPQDLELARGLFERALAADPELVSALAGLCMVLTYQVILGTAGDDEAQIANAIEYGRRAVEVDAEDPSAHLALGRAYGVAEDFEKAIRALQTALQRNPHYAAAHYTLGNVYITCGKLEEGIESVRKAIALSPQDSWMGGFYARLAQAYLCGQDYEQARRYAEEALALSGPVNWWGRSYLVSALGHLGRTGAARQALADLLATKPGLTVGWIRSQRSNLSMGQAFLDDYLDGLRKAGLPDQ